MAQKYIGMGFILLILISNGCLMWFRYYDESGNQVYPLREELSRIFPNVDPNPFMKSYDYQNFINLESRVQDRSLI